MRGIIAVALAIFGIGLIMLVAPVVEDVASVTTDNDAVQSSGNDETADDIVTSTLQWTPLIGILVALISALVFYLRKQRTTRRRRV